MAPTKAKKIFRLKVTLQDTTPVVWRRLLVPADMTLAKFHDVLQDAMPWTNSHLHCFEAWSGRYGMVGIEEDADDLKDERRVKLSAVLPSEGACLLYRYDYGDDWEHLVGLEAILEHDRRHQYPLCVGGSRACPPEDCGGTSGYDELCRVLKSPKDEEHDTTLTWVGGYFDPAGFDANAVNRAFRYGRR
jgi:Plasmid pRiA4b ORF-3-like protein